MKYPSLVKVLIAECDAWLIGESSVNSNNPRDYDLWIPINKWSIACLIIPKDSKVNSFGGFKCISDGKEVDVWTCELEKLLTTNYFTSASYPRGGITIKRQ